MVKLSNNELSEICNHLGQSKIINIQKIFGGCINHTWRLDFANSRFFLKKNERDQKLLKFEQYCLNDLRKYSNSQNIIIPEVIDYFEYEHNEYLLMEWLDLNNVSQKKLGVGIAEIHLNSNKKKPNKPDTLNYLGFTHRKVGDFENAEIYYSMGLELDPKHVGINEYMGELFVVTNRLDKAKERLAVLKDCNCKEYKELKLVIEGKKESKY